MNTTTTQIIEGSTSLTTRDSAVEIRFAGLQSFCVERSIFQTFPEILKRQIAYRQLCDITCGDTLRKQLVYRLISMLGIKFEKASEPVNGRKFTPMEFAIGELCAFLKDCPLTAEELLEAYRMGIKKQLIDREGKTIKIYPTLSVIQAGEVIDAYLCHKRRCPQYDKGLKLLEQLRLKQNRAKQLKESPQERREKLIAELRQSIVENREFHGAFLLYDYVVELGGFNEFRANKEAQNIAVQQKMNEILKQEKLKRTFYLYSRAEVEFLSNTLKENISNHSQTKPSTSKNYETELINRLKNQAILAIKNDLVTNWFKENH